MGGGSHWGGSLVPRKVGNPAVGTSWKTGTKGPWSFPHIGHKFASVGSSLPSNNEGTPKSSGGDAAGCRRAGSSETFPCGGSVDRLFVSYAMEGCGAPVAANAPLVGSCAKGGLHRPPGEKHQRTQRGRSQREGIVKQPQS